VIQLYQSILPISTGPEKPSSIECSGILMPGLHGAFIDLPRPPDT